MNDHADQIRSTLGDSPRTLHDRSTFEKAYSGDAPWDIGKPIEPLVAVADQVAGPVLDAGCGTGENSLFLAGRGLRVVGIDFVGEAIRRARSKAVERKINVDFRVADALALGAWDERFKSVVDSGLFHVFSDEDRARYVAGLARVVEPGGRIYLLCFSDEEPGTAGPRRVSHAELYNAFADGWQVESISPTRFPVNPKFTDVSFSEGGPKVWFAIIRRNA
jgi:SAM-dependent methyltransferase